MKVIISFLIFCLGSICNAELRTWTAVNGKEVEAEFVSNSDGQVSLKMKTGKIFKVPLNKLSKADQDFITKMPSADSAEVKPVEITAIARMAKEWKEKVESRRNDGDRYYYEKGTDTLYSGKWYEVENNGEIYGIATIKDGKFEGSATWYRLNGFKIRESHFKDGEEIEGSEKWWNDKGEPVETQLQALGKEEAKEIKNRVRVAKSINSMKQITLALFSYAKDHDERFPASLEDLIPDYLDDRSDD